MDLTYISITKTWLCATGVAVLATYFQIAHYQNTPEGQKRATEHTANLSRQGTKTTYKSQNAHSSAVKKTTTAKVAKVIQAPTLVSNPLYPRFMDALDRLTQDVAEQAEDGDVALESGFVLSIVEGKPILRFPDAYRLVVIGGVAMGDVVKGWVADVSRERVTGPDQWKVNGVSLRSCFKSLDEPEFYCGSVTYSVLPATRQVNAIRMRGELIVGNTANAQKMMAEIAGWMKKDYGAVERCTATPAGTLALKRFKIGEGMDVEVRVTWKQQRTDKGCDADIAVNFTTGELVEEERCQCEELEQAVETARFCLLRNTGVNYLTVRPKVSADAVKSKVVYR